MNTFSSGSVRNDLIIWIFDTIPYRWKHALNHYPSSYYRSCVKDWANMMLMGGEI